MCWIGLFPKGHGFLEAIVKLMLKIDHPTHQLASSAIFTVHFLISMLHCKVKQEMLHNKKTH